MKTLQVSLSPFHGSSSAFQQIHSDIFRMLEACKPTGVLFPKLHDLSWEFCEPHLFHYIDLFISPTLQSLSLPWMLISRAKQSTFIQSIVNYSPSLRKVELPRGVPPGIQRRVVSLISQLTNLEDLCIDLEAATPDDVVILAMHRRIRRLHLIIPHVAEEITLRSLTTVAESRSVTHQQWQPFPALECLFTQRLDIETCTAIVAFIKPRGLKEVTVIARPVPLIHQLETYFQTLSACCGHTTLVDITVAADKQSRSSLLLHPGILVPLLSFVRLEQLRIDLRSSLGINNTAIEQMALTWPNLRQLQLGALDDSPGVSGITLQGLIPLATHCPHLESIGFSIDASICEVGEERPGRGITNESLSIIEFGKSPVVDPAAVAAFLADIFPEVEYITAWETSDDAAPDRWDEVERLYEIFAKVRKQERNHIEMDTSSDSETDES
ncbi:hypothetical protein JAAARDRAFT_29989, partial [Jaapia argillacea MUCL 33604]